MELIAARAGCVMCTRVTVLIEHQSCGASLPGQAQLPLFHCH